VIANGATRGADNSASVKLDYAAAWYSWMIPPSTSRRPTSLSDRRAEVTSLAGAGTWPPWRETAARTATAGSRAETVPAKGAPDRARRDANAEASKLALDADTAPTPVRSRPTAQAASRRLLKSALRREPHLTLTAASNASPITAEAT